MALTLFIVSCEQQVTKKYLDYKVQGVDRHENNRVCFNDPDKVCAEVTDTEEEEFAKKCKKAGNKVHPCGCYEYICEQKIFKGYDIAGKVRSCAKMSASVTCTMEFADSDQYARDCESDGGTAVQCGCHDYICHYPGLVIDTAPAKPDPISEFLGTNQDGIVRSCSPQTGINCPSVISRAHVYAQNCKEEGYQSVWCSCDEVLCLDQ